MTTKPELQASKYDNAKLALAALVLTAALGGFYYFSEQMLLVRVAGLLVAVAAAFGIVFTTELGSNGWAFLQDARGELRKVVWPTRAETIQTSLVVMAMVIVMGIFLWLLDMLLFWVIRLFTGQGG